MSDQSDDLKLNPEFLALLKEPPKRPNVVKAQAEMLKLLTSDEAFEEAEKRRAYIMERLKQSDT